MRKLILLFLFVLIAISLPLYIYADVVSLSASDQKTYVLSTVAKFSNFNVDPSDPSESITQSNTYLHFADPTPYNKYILGGNNSSNVKFPQGAEYYEDKLTINNVDQSIISDLNSGARKLIFLQSAVSPVCTESGDGCFSAICRNISRCPTIDRDKDNFPHYSNIRYFLKPDRSSFQEKGSTYTVNNNNSISVTVRISMGNEVNAGDELIYEIILSDSFSPAISPTAPLSDSQADQLKNQLLLGSSLPTNAYGPILINVGAPRSAQLGDPGINITQGNYKEGKTYQKTIAISNIQPRHYYNVWRDDNNTWFQLYWDVDPNNPQQNSTDLSKIQIKNPSSSSITVNPTGITVASNGQGFTISFDAAFLTDNALTTNDSNQGKTLLCIKQTATEGDTSGCDPTIPNYDNNGVGQSCLFAVTLEGNDQQKPDCSTQTISGIPSWAPVPSFLGGLPLPCHVDKPKNANSQAAGTSNAICGGKNCHGTCIEINIRNSGIQQVCIDSSVVNSVMDQNQNGNACSPTTCNAGQVCIKTNSPQTISLLQQAGINLQSLGITTPGVCLTKIVLAPQTQQNFFATLWNEIAFFFTGQTFPNIGGPNQITKLASTTTNASQTKAVLNDVAPTLACEPTLTPCPFNAVSQDCPGDPTLHQCILPTPTPINSPTPFPTETPIPTPTPQTCGSIVKQICKANETCSVNPVGIGQCLTPTPPPASQTCGSTVKQTCKSNQTCVVDAVGIGTCQDGTPTPVPGTPTPSCSQVDTAIGPVGTNIQDFIKSIFGVLLSLSGGIALLIIMYNGYRIMTSQGNPEQIKKSREWITSGIVGLVFAILSLSILQIIGVNILHIPGFGP